MKNLLLITCISLFSVVSYAQNGKVQIYDKFYMESASRLGPIYDLPASSLLGGNFLLSITLDRTKQEITAGPYFDISLQKYVFPLNPKWTDVRESDTFTIRIRIAHGCLQFLNTSKAYAGFDNPTFIFREFTAKSTAINLSNVSRGIPMIVPHFSSASIPHK